MTADNEKEPAPKGGYRPDFDGLRAVAVGLVLAFHLGAPFKDSGQTGVTIFFVLSGYLITSLLRAEHAETGRLDLRRFYIRRARRLVPALVAVLVTVAFMATLRGSLLQQLPQITVAGLYVSNFAHQLGVTMGRLDHTWTLAVEEQFYLAWPVLLIAASRWPLIALVGLPLLGLNGFAALAVGCLLAIVGVPRLPSVVLIPALGGLLLSMAGVVVIATPAAALLLAYIIGRPSRVLATRPFVEIGKLSYGIYLWQYPVLWEFPDAASQPLAIVALTVTLAWISARFVEAPFRSRHLERATTIPNQALVIVGRATQGSGSA